MLRRLVVSSSVRCAVIVSLLASLTARHAQAQREQLVVRVETFGTTDVTAPRGTSLAHRYEQQSTQLSLAQRVLRDQGSTVLLLGAQWRAVRVPLPQRLGITPADPDRSTLHVATADLMLLRTMGDRHTLVGVVRPGLYGNAWRAEGAAFVDRIVSPKTTVGLGLSYGSAYGKLLPIPVVHVVSRTSRRVLVDALLPARADVWYMPRKGLDLGINASLSGAQYGLTDAQRVQGATALWLANATVGPQLRWSPRGGKWQLTADGGMTLVRRLEYARDGRAVHDLSPGNVPYGRLGLQRLF